MNTITLIVANLRAAPLTALFNIMLLATGVAIILTLFHLDRQIGDRMTRDLKGIDLVVSGKGSPLQIILSSVFHLDIPTGNIPVSDARRLAKSPLIKQAIPLALGDNFKGFRIVGTVPAYAGHYKATFSEGTFWSGEMEAVLGADVAVSTGLKIGQTFSGSHGLVAGGETHDHDAYTVTGILKPTGGVIDRLVLTDVSSVWHIHEEAEKKHHNHEESNDDHDKAHEYTALLISYASPMAAATLPRQINAESRMQAASPAVEVARLTKLMGTGTDLLSAFGVLLLGFSAFGFFVTLSNAVHERLYDIAMLRVLGATRSRVFCFIQLEALTLGTAGVLLGLLLARAFVEAIGTWLETTRHITLASPATSELDIGVVIAALALSAFAGMIPAIKAYRINISQTLAKA